MFGKNCIRANLRFTAANVDEIADCPVRVGRLHLKGLVGFRISNGTTILNAAFRATMRNLDVVYGLMTRNAAQSFKFVLDGDSHVGRRRKADPLNSVGERLLRDYSAEQVVCGQPKIKHLSLG